MLAEIVLGVFGLEEVFGCRSADIARDLFFIVVNTFALGLGINTSSVSVVRVRFSDDSGELKVIL